MNDFDPMKVDTGAIKMVDQMLKTIADNYGYENMIEAVASAFVAMHISLADFDLESGVKNGCNHLACAAQRIMQRASEDRRSP